MSDETGEAVRATPTWEMFHGVNRPDGELAMNAYLDMPEPVPTGVSKLDQLLGGGMTRGVTVLGGESSAGKTVTACMAAAMMAMRGQKVVYASYETAWEIVQLRCASVWSCTPKAKSMGAEPFSWSDVVNGYYRSTYERYKGLDRGELSRYLVGSAADPITRTLTLWDEGPGRNLAVLSRGYDVNELTKMVRTIHHERPVLVVDYIQIMPTGATHKQDDNERITEVMEKLREYSYSPDGGNILSISSLRKLSPQDRKDGPTMDWFRGSNHIGYDAEQAVILTVDKKKDEEGRLINSISADGGTEVRFTCVKNRTGATGRSIPAILYGWNNLIS